MRYLHTMVRVKNLEESLHFYQTILGLAETKRIESEEGKFSLIYLAAPNDKENAAQTEAPLIELTYNWDSHEHYETGRSFGHIAFEVDDIYETCKKIMNAGIAINRPPRDGYMAFIKSPDNISIELLQKGEKKPPQAPWDKMENIGTW